jgi:LPXTG-site transpeptidase (sortase) family protein
MKSNIVKIIGDSLILLSVGFFLFLGYPLLRMYLFPPQYVREARASDQFSLHIPRIRAQSPVVEQVNPWNEAVYNVALKNGVAHARGSGLPGDKRTIFLFAHSSGMPWEQLYTNTIFLRLGELESGDEVILERKQKRFVYVVTEKKEVLPTDIQYLENLSPDQLILQTCTPIGTSLRRLLVFAKPAEPALLQSQNEH